MKKTAPMALCALMLVACTTKEAAPPADTAAAAVESDPDRVVAGGGIPAGYSARTDRADADISGARYVTQGNTWEITTGPPHVIYAAKDTASGNYTVSATIEQLEKPTHPEAYGLIIGGRNLDGPDQAYTYMLVRGTGDVLVKVREGTGTRDVVKWTPVAGVPREDAAGKAKYDLSARVTNEAVRFSVNGKEVASMSTAGLPTDGIAGLRINHNLHVRATPVTITRP